jgi:hypothetical protein
VVRAAQILAQREAIHRLTFPSLPGFGHFELRESILLGITILGEVPW